MLYLPTLKILAVTKHDPTEKLVFVDPTRQCQLESTASTALFGSNEDLFGIFDWQLTIRSVKFNYLVVGTGTSRPPGSNAPKSERGKVRILKLQRIEYRSSEPDYDIQTSIEVRKQFVWTAPDAVLAVAPFHYSILYSSGYKLYMKSLNTEMMAFDTVPLEITLPSPVLSITTSENRIFASTQKNSVVLIGFENRSLVFLESDSVSRNMFHHMQILPDFVVGSDKDRSVFGLVAHDGRRHFANLELQFRCKLSTSISRLGLGRFKPVYFQQEDDGGQEADLNDEVIVGTGVNGSIYGFQVLTGQELNTLVSGHLKTVIAEIARYLARKQTYRGHQVLSKTDVGFDSTYPVQLALITPEFGLAPILTDPEIESFQISSSTARTKQNQASYVEEQFLNLSFTPLTKSSSSSVYHVDSDVLAYLSDLLFLIKNNLTSKSRRSRRVTSISSTPADTLAEPSAREGTSTPFSESFRALVIDNPSKKEGHIFEWMDKVLNGIML
ncbi:uncharacterized protein V1516DRAFT_623095 [Lipomyces oligophaga]|uniref:uncharacterized protein n=1 Tax=Lipomyces oligophaga TaxID=45792 RepID=UPI0034CD0916